MNDFCDLLGTLDAPVSKIASVNGVPNPYTAFERKKKESQAQFFVREKVHFAYLVVKIQRGGYIQK